MKKILIVVGTRPNFIKVTQFVKISKKHPSLGIKIVHTGQHFDEKMSEVFFNQFNLIPDFFLNISPNSAITQIAETMINLEKLIENEYYPDLLIVVGDVNSTFAAALVANKLNIKLAHVESGLRSFDSSMPEENNRILTDAISDYFFVTEESGFNNLLNENKLSQNIFFVGNTMIDTLIAFKNQINSSNILEKLQLKKENYVLMTMHRPATVDESKGLAKLMNLVDEITSSYKLVFSIHPRTLKNLKKENLLDRFNSNQNIIVTEPLDYFSFQKLIANCIFILTDSGGIQEESTFLKKPCLTLRPNTERPSTCSIGTNTLIPFDLDVIRNQILLIQNGKYKEGKVPDFWDGKSTERIFEKLIQILK